MPSPLHDNDVVWIVKHEHSKPGFEDETMTKFIGIYSSAENAAAAVERLKQQPGFSTYPEGFRITRSLINQDGWPEGFVTVGEALDALEEP